jgi:hypothetical protein
MTPGDAAHSGIVGRMAVRGKDEQMPPLGTDVIDVTGVERVASWIASLDRLACPAADTCATPAAP